MYRNLDRLKYRPNRDSTVGTKSNRISKAIAVAANKAGISHEEGERIAEHIFLWIKRWMTHYSMPRIRIMYFGEFSPSIGAINGSIRRRLSILRRTKRHRVYYRLLYFIALYWPVRNRLIREQRGEITYNEWLRKENWMPQKASMIQRKRKEEWKIWLARKEQMICDEMERCEMIQRIVDNPSESGQKATMGYT